jgi:hypothetical protein
MTADRASPVLGPGHRAGRAIAAALPGREDPFAPVEADAVDLGTVRTDLLSTVDRALEPAHVTVWTAPAD